MTFFCCFFFYCRIKELEKKAQRFVEKKKIGRVITSQKSSREIEDFCENQFCFELEIIISKHLVEKKIVKGII